MNPNCDPECQAMLAVRRAKKRQVKICGPCGGMILASSVQREGGLQAVPMGAKMGDAERSEAAAQEMGNRRDDGDIIYPSEVQTFSIETNGGPVIIDVENSAHPLYTMPSDPKSRYFLVPGKAEDLDTKIGFYVGNGSNKPINVTLEFQGAYLGKFRIDPGEDTTIEEFLHTGKPITLGPISDNPLGEDTGLLSVVVAVVDTPFSRRNAPKKAKKDKKKNKNKDKKKNKIRDQPPQEEEPGQGEQPPQTEQPKENDTDTPLADQHSTNDEFNSLMNYEETDAGIPVEIYEAYARVVVIAPELINPPDEEPGVPIVKINSKPTLPKNIGM